MLATCHETPSGARFTLVDIEQGVPVIRDDSGRRTLTNAAEEIVAKVLEVVGGEIRAILYRDALGRLDALAVDRGRFAGFIILNAHTRREALIALPDAVRRPL